MSLVAFKYYLKLVRTKHFSNKNKNILSLREIILFIGSLLAQRLVYCWYNLRHIATFHIDC